MLINNSIIRCLLKPEMLEILVYLLCRFWTVIVLRSKYQYRSIRMVSFSLPFLSTRCHKCLVLRSVPLCVGCLQRSPHPSRSSFSHTGERGEVLTHAASHTHCAALIGSDSYTHMQEEVPLRIPEEFWKNTLKYLRNDDLRLEQQFHA